MTFLGCSFTVGVICGIIAAAKNKSIEIAFLCGFLFNIFALVYYCFCKSK